MDYCCLPETLPTVIFRFFSGGFRSGITDIAAPSPELFTCNLVGAF